MSPLQIVQAATRAINEGRIDHALQYYTDDVRQYSPGQNGNPEFLVREGKEALRRVLEADMNSPLQAKYLHDRYVTDGITVAVQGKNSGIIGDKRINYSLRS